MKACPKQLYALKSISSTFANCTGLKVNYLKSSMFLVNFPQERLEMASFKAIAGAAAVMRTEECGATSSIYYPGEE
jgi:hypothetical protein